MRDLLYEPVLRYVHIQAASHSLARAPAPPPTGCRALLLNAQVTKPLPAALPPAAAAASHAVPDGGFDASRALVRRRCA